MHIYMSHFIPWGKSCMLLYGLNEFETALVRHKNKIPKWRIKTYTYAMQQKWSNMKDMITPGLQIEEISVGTQTIIKAILILGIPLGYISHRVKWVHISIYFCPCIPMSS